MKNETFNKARAFIYRNARPIDLTRWQYHFEYGKDRKDRQNAVMKALAAYQNEDGGFGHALEPDSWNPNSSPIQTWTATEILREIDFTDVSHPIMQGILHYLESTKDFNSHYWYANVETNIDFPRAPWWGFSDKPEHRCNNYNPTACLAGFIVRFADKDSELYALGCKIAQEAFKAYMNQDLTNDMHSVGCYVRLLQYCEEADIACAPGDFIDLSKLKEKLKLQVKACITQNTSEWETSYICKPSQFIVSKSSIFYTDNKEISDYECEHIINTQLEDGSWNIPWNWNEYPDEWAVSRNWWKGNGAVLNMLYLKGMGRL